MFKTYIVLFMLGHVLGDFYLQSSEMAEKKEKEIKWVILHALLYSVTMLLICISYISLDIFVISIAASGIHFFIDFGKYFIVKKLSKYQRMSEKMQRRVFLVDQILHITSLVFISYGMIKSGYKLCMVREVQDFFSVIGINAVQLMEWVLALLMIHKPANIIVQKVLGEYKPKENKTNFKKDHNAGRMIGTIERVIMLFLISFGQYAAAGFVLTAKSIARYERISKDTEFAEYYLLGTLLSAAIVLITAIVLL